MQNQGLGRHVLVECYDADFSVLNDLDRIRDTPLDAAEWMGATIISDKFHRFAPQGVSGAVVIAESHLTIHTWPELGYAAIDFFTCGESDPRAGFLELAKRLGSATMKIVEFARGFPSAQNAPTAGLGGSAAQYVGSWTYRLEADTCEEVEALIA